MVDLLFILLSLILLAIGSEGLVRGSSGLASKLGMSPLVIGLTIVAFGTSSPEIVVSLKAATSGSGAVALGNVIGSNIFNIGLILGLSAIICPLKVHQQVISFDGRVAVLVTLLFFVIFFGGISRIEGGLLLSGLIVYIFVNIRFATNHTESGTVEAKETEIEHPTSGYLFLFLMISGGLGLLLIGGNLLVHSSIKIARFWGVSEAVIGLTVVAAGTSIPELATSINAAFRSQHDIAVGNVVGSNIFNILGILGLCGLIGIEGALGIRLSDMLIMLLLTIALYPMLKSGFVLDRFEGVLLLAFYAAYLVFLFVR